jgi:hypothetical protein
LKTKLLHIFLLFWLLSFSFFPDLNKEATQSEVIHSANLAEQINPNPRTLLPVFIRLQALQKSNITLWQSIPQNFTDHVAKIDLKVLAAFLSSNLMNFSLSRDSVENLWLSANASLNEGDYISTLVWVSSQTVSENLSSLGSVTLTENYRDDVEPFLYSGRKIPVDNQIIQKMAANYTDPDNMTQTVKNIIDQVQKQEYDSDKSRLLLSGNLNTTDMLDSFKDALEVLKTNSSICSERSWLAAALLRAAGVPTRTVMDVRLKTWIQVWLPPDGWVDAEALSVQPPPLFPRPLSTSTPWTIENSSDAGFPFTWLPKVPIRVANLTFNEVSLFNPSEYRTVLSEPIDWEVFKGDPTKFCFPIAFKNDIIYQAAITREGNKLTFSLFKENENASKTITLGESNSFVLGDVTVSFRPLLYQNFLVMQDFAVGEVWNFDVRTIIPVVGVTAIAVIVWFYWRKTRKGR